MFIKVKRCVDTSADEEITLNTDQIVFYFQHRFDTTMLHMSSGVLLEIRAKCDWFDDFLVYKNTDPTPIKKIDDNPLGFEPNPEPIHESQDTDERLATSKQIAYVRSIAKKKGLDLKLPKTITFKFARDFLDKYAPKKKPVNKFDWDQLDEDADGEFPGYRD